MKNGMGTAAASSLSEKTNNIWLDWKAGSCCAVAPLPSPKPMMCKERVHFTLR